MSRILIGVTGGVAAYKALELVRLATKAGHSVRVLQTPASENFVGRASFEALSGAPVLVGEFDGDPALGSFPGDEMPRHAPIDHLELPRRADAYVIVPASANTIAKLAHGLADSMVTTSFLAFRGPCVVCPAMNDAMWSSGATQANVELLKKAGVVVFGPAVGPLASIGEWGAGRMAEPPEILAAVERELGVGAGRDSPSLLAGKRVVVTAGGTREPIDPVRFMGNRSSGGMGLAIGDEAARRGAKTVVIAANVALPRNPGIEYVDVETAAEMRDVVSDRFGEADVLVMAAAVSDFTVASPDDRKLERTGAGVVLDLVPTADILAEMARRRKPGQTIVGFAAEFGGDCVGRAREKLERKGVDAIVANDVSRPGIGFDSDDNEAVIVTEADERPISRRPKAGVASAILDWIEDRIG